MTQTGSHIKRIIILVILLLLISPEPKISIDSTAPPQKFGDTAPSQTEPKTAVGQTKPQEPPKKSTAFNQRPLKSASQTLILKLRSDRPIDPQGILASYQAKPAVQTRNLINLEMMLVTFPNSWDAAAVIAELERDPAVQYISEDAEVRGWTASHQPPNDPGYRPEPEPSGTYRESYDYLKAINALDAWNYTTGSTEVVVAVLDTGIDFTHPDIVNNLWMNSAELNGDPGVDDDHPNGPTPCTDSKDSSSGYYCDDIHGWSTISDSADVWDNNRSSGHGTSVAGVIGAQGNNGIHSVGVAWRVRLMPVKVLYSDNFGFATDLLQGLDYVLEMRKRGVNLRVANLSLGFEPETKEGMKDGLAAALRDSITQLQEAGILVVTAAGNCGFRVPCDGGGNLGNGREIISVNDALPGSLAFELDNMLNVGALDGNKSFNAIASFSYYGSEYVSLGAPGSTLLALSSSLNGYDRRQIVFPPLWANDLPLGWELRDGRIRLTAVSDPSTLVSSTDDLSELPEDEIAALYFRISYQLPKASRSGNLSGLAPLVCGENLYCMRLSFRADGLEWEGQVIVFDDSEDFEDLVWRLPDQFRTSGFQFRIEPIPIATPVTAMFEMELANLIELPPVARTAALRDARGTSYAAPQVAGAAALLWAHRPELNYQDVRSAILNTVTSIPQDCGPLGRERCFQRNGRLNLSRALASVTTPTLVIGEIRRIAALPGEGSRVQLSVRLSREPGVLRGPKRVQVALAEAHLTSVPQMLSFTDTDWHIPKTISLPLTCGVLTLQVLAANSDPDYAEASAVISTVPADALCFSGIENRSIAEGEQHTFELSLSEAPSTTITLTPAAQPAGQLTFEPPQLVFTPENWSPKRITVTAPADLQDVDTRITLSFEIQEDGLNDGEESMVVPPYPIAIYIDRGNPVTRLRLRIMLESALP